MISKWNQQQKQPTQTQQSKQKKKKNVWTQYISKHSDSSKIKQIILKTWKIKWDRENPYLFLEDLGMRWCRNGVWRGWHGVFGSVSVKRESE